MSGEVRFTNENEVAFAKLRLGCRHGGAHGGAALRQVQPQQQAVVVSFLARMAGRRRRCAARRVQELGCILAKASASWQELLAKEEPLGGPSGLLAEELKALATGAMGRLMAAALTILHQPTDRPSLRGSLTDMLASPSLASGARRM
ncbi:unnamed protein product [Effrenium voratum]|nr:unnamed protein product [Effrenium voratum]